MKLFHFQSHQAEYFLKHYLGMMYFNTHFFTDLIENGMALRYPESVVWIQAECK